MELLVIEAGVSTQILAQAYQPYSIWVTHCWLKSVWEKIDLFNLTVKIKPLPLRFPWTNDNWLMLIFVKTGYSNGDLVRLNRVCCHQQVLFYSDIERQDDRQKIQDQTRAEGELVNAHFPRGEATLKGLSPLAGSARRYRTTWHTQTASRQANRGRAQSVATRGHLSRGHNGNTNAILAGFIQMGAEVDVG
jgi:hypothetical protein